jgi:hypothetical protein
MYESLVPTLQVRYREITEPKPLWDKIKADFQKIMELDGKYKWEKQANCKLESYSSIFEWISAQDSIIRDLWYRGR